MRDRTFLKLFVGQLASSFGDWIGLIAILALIERIYHNEFAVSAVLLARLIPALFFAPIAGVIVDRWDRKRVMVACDIGRAALIATLPFLEPISRAVPLANPVVLLFVVSAGLEMLNNLWQPSRDASLPRLIKDPKLMGDAFGLLQLAVYATFPLSGAAFGLLAQASKWLGESFNLRQFLLNQEHLALFLDSFTFILSATVTMLIAFRPLARTRRSFRMRSVWDDFVEGMRTIWSHPLIRPWLVGIAGAFVGVGTFITMGLLFVREILDAGSAGFGLLVTTVGIGLATGFVAQGGISRLMPRDVLFSSVIIGMGLSLIGFGSVSSLTAAALMGVLCGFFSGCGYPTGYALVQGHIGEHVRGRTSAAVNSLMRLSMVSAAAIAPALVKVVDSIIGLPVIRIGDSLLDIRGARVVMWLGGLFVLATGIFTTRAIRARVRGQLPGHAGIFIAFEGGDGAGKSTQIDLLRSYLESRGLAVRITFEPGATQVGKEIRDLLLDPQGHALGPKTEALLYAADRAQHVHELIKPALERGEIVISDRYLDSSVAYQGLARGLGADQIREMSLWATENLLPDVVFLLDVETSVAEERTPGSDRMEMEGHDFRERVRKGYQLLAQRFPHRFVVIDASLPEEEVASIVRLRIEPLLESMNAKKRPRHSAKAVAT